MVYSHSRRFYTAVKWITVHRYSVNKPDIILYGKTRDYMKCYALSQTQWNLPTKNKFLRITNTGYKIMVIFSRKGERQWNMMEEEAACG